MRILFGLGHPAHYHLFKNVFKNFRSRNIDFKIVITDKDILSRLLKDDGYDFVQLLKKNPNETLLKKARSILSSTLELSKDIGDFNPTLYIGCISQIVYAGFFNRIPSLFFAEDDFKITYLQGLSLYPFVSHVISPDVTDVDYFSFKKFSYNGYHELAYLHPNQFKPDRKIVEKYFSTDEPFFVLRFASLNAYHDVGIKGLTTNIARNLIEILEPYGKIYITSEIPLVDELEKYRIAINVVDMHHILAFAKLYIGDSQTMAAESGVLGTPFIRFNDFVGKIGYLNDLENNYRLGFGIKPKDEDLLYKTVNQLLFQKDLDKEWQKRRKVMLADKIDVNAFYLWFIENYPKSKTILKENPDYQLKFK